MHAYAYACIHSCMNACIYIYRYRETRAHTHALTRSLKEPEPGLQRTRLQTWFYFGFNRRYNLSNRKLASIGQKLPVDWEEHLRRLQERVARQQFPHTMNIGTEENPQMVAVPGLDDDHWINFDHVPVWIEGVGNHSWGPRDSGRRNVKTGGKEKNRFTVVLTITKNGKKGIPFIISKGMLYVYSIL